MDILSKIKQPIEGELIRLNEVIVQILSSTSPLLSRIVDHYLSMKGKQIRPILVLLTARLVGDIKPETIYGAAAVELLHNATLIHDDVVDESKLRRGKTTINGIWDNRIAVLAGDYFVSSALQAALPTRSIRVMEVLAYFNVIRQKTASLFIACMHIGALTSGMSPEQTSAVKGFGERLGLCFQIKDDIFDYFAAGEIGKPTRSDLSEGKVTLPLIYALTHTEGSRCAEMKSLVAKPELSEDEISRLVAFAVENGGIEYAEKVMEQLRNEARRYLEPFFPSPAAESLMSVFDYTISRAK